MALQSEKNAKSYILFQILFKTTLKSQKSSLRLKNKKTLHAPLHSSKLSHPIPSSHHPIPSPSLFFIISPPPSAQFQTKIKSHRLSLLDLILPNYIIKSPHFSQLNFHFSPPPFFFHPTSYILATLHPIICSHFSSQKSQRVFRSQST